MLEKKLACADDKVTRNSFSQHERTKTRVNLFERVRADGRPPQASERMS